MEKNVKNESFKPFISADKVMPEFTITSIILGIILAVVFGGANAYLGLRVGMTVSASIPAAVISMGIIRMVLKKESILENNMVQTIGSAGESVAAGAIFTIPAIFMWAKEGADVDPSFVMIAIIALVGGALGVLFMIPLRSALIVKEHGVLPYPEGTACAEVLMAGEEGGAKAGGVFRGLGVAALYKILSDGFKLFPSEIDYSFESLPGAGIGMDVLPALAGVGYICGPKISSYMLAGGTVAWFVIMPIIALFGADVVMFPATDPISQLSTSDIWTNYVRYIGAGAVAAGGIISLIKSLPLIVTTFRDSMKSFGVDRGADIRTNRDLNMKLVIGLIIILALVMVFVPSIPVGFGGAIIIVLFGFFFATVSSRMVGLVGSSNNPVSGMTIATLLLATLILKSTGHIGIEGMVSAICIGSVICIIAAIAGDTSQDLKTGYIVGSTPKKQQIGELIGVVASALAIGGILALLDAAWGYGSTELPAPQATLMKMVVEGVMNGNLPWNLVFVGVGLAVVVEILQVPVLPFAIGLYLPIHLSTPIMVGGIIKWAVDRKKYKSEEAKKEVVTNGILYTSGLIAGEGLIGILLAVFALIPVGIDVNDKVISLGDKMDMGCPLGSIGSIVFFGLLVFLILKETIFSKAAKEK